MVDCMNKERIFNTEEIERKWKDWWIEIWELRWTSRVEEWRGRQECCFVDGELKRYIGQLLQSMRGVCLEGGRRGREGIHEKVGSSTFFRTVGRRGLKNPVYNGGTKREYSGRLNKEAQGLKTTTMRTRTT